MSAESSNPYASLDRVFHEPSRLAIISSLGGAIGGLTFNELKEICKLTDGNLSRHLKTLEEAGAIRVKKSSAGHRSRTSILLSDLGRERFVEYLRALEKVLVKASQSMAAEQKAASFRSLWEGQFGTGIFDME